MSTENLVTQPLTELQDKMTSMASEMTELLTQGARVIGKFTKIQSNLVDRNRDAKNKLSATNIQLAATNTQLAATNTQLAETKGQLAATNAQLAETKGQVGTAKKTIAELQIRVQTLAEEKDADKKQIAQLTQLTKKRSAQVVELSAVHSDRCDDIQQEQQRRKLEKSECTKVFGQLKKSEYKKFFNQLEKCVEVLQNMEKEELPSIYKDRQTIQAPMAGDHIQFSRFDAPIEALSRVEPCTKKFDLSGSLGEYHDEDLLDGQVKDKINEARADLKEFHVITNRGLTWHESMPGYDQFMAMIIVSWTFFFDAYCVGLVVTNIEGLGLLRVELLFNQFVFHCVEPSYTIATADAKLIRAREVIPSFDAEQMNAYNIMKDEYLKRFDQNHIDNGLSDDLKAPVYNPDLAHVWVNDNEG